MVIAASTGERQNTQCGQEAAYAYETAANEKVSNEQKGALNGSGTLSRTSIQIEYTAELVTALLKQQKLPFRKTRIRTLSNSRAWTPIAGVR